MNYLSHLLLSHEVSDETHLGNFLGDVLRKRDIDSLSEKIKTGIWFHRAIDSYTDNHPIVKQGKQLLYPIFGKYAAVVLDVYFDFILIDNWTSFYDTPLNVFLEDCYRFIDKHMDKVPLRVRSQVIAMNQARWMDGYLTEKGRAAVFARLDKRASFETHFDKAMQVLLEKEQALTSLHKVFFLELRKQNFNAQP